VPRLQDTAVQWVGSSVCAGRLGLRVSGGAPAPGYGFSVGRVQCLLRALGHSQCSNRMGSAVTFGGAHE
jgi:hypothetical protein